MKRLGEELMPLLDDESYAEKRTRIENEALQALALRKRRQEFLKMTLTSKELHEFLWELTLRVEALEEKSRQPLFGGNQIG